MVMAGVGEFPQTRVVYMKEGVKELPFTATVRSQGRITIPESVRKALKISEGEVVHITIKVVEQES